MLAKVEFITENKSNYGRGASNMEKAIKCKSLVAIFKEDNLVLDGPHEIKFDIKKGRNVHICIEQYGIRKITILSDEDIVVFDLYAILTKVERLLMLLDGIFITLSEIQLSDSNTVDDVQLRSCESHLLKQRLSYFESADFCNYSVDKLLDFEDVFTEEFYYKWEDLLYDLDVVNQMYLYAISDNRMPVDIKCAFLIELAEPLVEIVKQHTKFYTSLNPGARGTTLKNCLDALISKYGVEIFKSELLDEYEKILTVMVNSRVRIMHIKRKQSGTYFNGSESVLYALKMSLLYRKIIFEILNIDEKDYKEKMEKNISKLDSWNDTLNNFLIRIQK